MGLAVAIKGRVLFGAKEIIGSRKMENHKGEGSGMLGESAQCMVAVYEVNSCLMKRRASEGTIDSSR
jgi:hypothetical protein